MKAADPAILIGAVGPTAKNAAGKRDEEQGRKNSWWQTVLSKAGPHLDWLSIHDYPCWHWGSYNYFAEHQVDFGASLDSVQAALDAWGPQGRNIPILVTEMNSADWEADEKKKTGWAHRANLGHALVLFDMLDTYTRHPRCQAALLWNTRWIRKEGPGTQLWDAIDSENEPTAIGAVLELWSSKLGGARVNCAAAHPLKCVAAAKNGKLSVAILNRAMEPREARLELDKPNLSGTITTWSSESVEDETPRWSTPEKVSLENGSVQLKLPAHSISMLELE